MSINVKKDGSDETEEQDLQLVLEVFTFLTMAKNQKLYNDYKNNLLYNNRFGQLNESFWDEVLRQLDSAKVTLKRGKALYRARILDKEFEYQFVESLWKSMLNKKEEIPGEAFHGLMDYDAFNAAVEYYDEKNELGLLERKQRFLKEYNEKIFQGFDESNSGAPPAKLAREGRLNPRSVAYLYTATDVKTAVHEVKPYIGQAVSMAKLKTKTTLKLLDLTKNFPPETLNFDIYQINIKSILSIIAEEFAKPNEGDGFNYIPTQYFSEYIKNMKDEKGKSVFDGIKFKSSVKKGGTNIVLFDPGCCDILSSKILNIREIGIKFEDVKFIV